MSSISATSAALSASASSSFSSSSTRSTTTTTTTTTSSSTSSLSSRRTRVFISYACNSYGYTSGQHHDLKLTSQLVASLVATLRGKYSIDVQFDQPYFITPMSSGWAVWMRQQIEEADFILYVATKTYKERASGTNHAKDPSTGVKLEGEIISNRLHHLRKEEKTFSVIPIMFTVTEEFAKSKVENWTSSRDEVLNGSVVRVGDVSNCVWTDNMMNLNTANPQHSSFQSLLDILHYHNPNPAQPLATVSAYRPTPATQHQFNLFEAPTDTTSLTDTTRATAEQKQVEEPSLLEEVQLQLNRNYYEEFTSWVGESTAPILHAVSELSSVVTYFWPK